MNASEPNVSGEHPGDALEKWSAQLRVLLASNEYLFVEYPV
ncbi:MAG: hypothetical protein R3C28_21580 [Pirellulaceae bacterium]